ncbi:DUF808 domain-containing protein [uncultured Psychromonas sp.]|uniref:DUF808 domain-containing protein n=1 Tax=uncultured Psychromonas sp. TaxID=173974 RepID=UPI002621A4F1|nr:DUF808 domain-containing protein [uncultured Psychromonas sp.]
MAGLSLLTLLDDIVAVLDDVALMSKVAAKKTAGVLGDDLALNAQQVSGVRAEREIPVVWAVAKGSFLNKAIIVPIALILSAFLPTAITVLLVIGGLYLCFEGAEKIIHSLFSKHEKEQAKQVRKEANANQSIDLVALEKSKIKGAIRTDFILSAEIVVIALGTMPQASFLTQILLLSTIAIALTIFVYGLVAVIVKLDDLGIYLISSAQKNDNKFKNIIGEFLINAAPLLMKFLVIVGTIAMFLVGGGIIVHNVPVITDFIHHIEQPFSNMGALFEYITPTILTGLVGISAGILCFLSVTLASNLLLSLKK